MWNATCPRIRSVAKPYHVQLGAFLRKQRGDKTYEQFARQLGLSRATVHRLEQGHQNVTLNTLQQLTSRLKCTLGDIFD